MKKLQIILLAGMSIASVTATDAQLLTAKLPAEEKSFDPSAAPAEAARYSSASVMITKGGTRAVKDFGKKFNNREDANWFAETNVITASFTEDNTRTTTVYAKNGAWLRNMKIYPEAKMPADVRELVKRSTYFDHSINQVQEILEKDILFYIVHLEDAKSWKQITVYNGEINLLSQVKKQ